MDIANALLHLIVSREAAPNGGVIYNAHTSLINFIAVATLTFASSMI